MPQTHHANKRPSQMRTEVLGSIPLQKAVAAASAIPPSTHTAWPTHALGQGISSLSSTFLPNNTHGQNNPVKPTTHKMIPYSIIYYEKKQKKNYYNGSQNESILTTISIFKAAKNPSCPIFISRRLIPFW